MWNLLLFIILGVVMSEGVIIVTALQEDDRTVNRINYGVIFKYVKIFKYVHQRLKTGDLRRPPDLLFDPFMLAVWITADSPTE